jgi:hypothetical protein
MSLNIYALFAYALHVTATQAHIIKESTGLCTLLISTLKVRRCCY